MSVAIVIQARMGSERLPGKVMRKAAGKPLLEHMLRRVQKVRNTTVIVAATENKADQPIVDLCEKIKVPCTRGSEHDVLSRYLKASEGYDVVVRLTGDCPLIDPEIVQKAIEEFLRGHEDYVSNTIQRTYPRGMDVEVMSRGLLEELNRRSIKPSEREHVTLYLHAHPEKFFIKQITMSPDRSDLRLTVDTEEDFQLIEHILDKKPGDKLSDVLELLKVHPEWTKLNDRVKQKDPYQ